MFGKEARLNCVSDKYEKCETLENRSDSVSWLACSEKAFESPPY